MWDNDYLLFKLKSLTHTHILQGWYSEDCSKPCVHGYVNSANDFCHCDSCYTGAYCELECSGHGDCVNETCDCFTTEPGEYKILVLYR